VLANKIDRLNVASEEEIKQVFGLQQLTTGKVPTHLTIYCLVMAVIIVGIYYREMFHLVNYKHDHWRCLCAPC